METSRDLFRMVEGDEVLEEGSRVLAFIDELEEHGFEWMLAKRSGLAAREALYVAAIRSPEGRVLEGYGPSPGGAIKELSRVLVEEGRRGLPRC